MDGSARPPRLHPSLSPAEGSRWQQRAARRGEEKKVESCGGPRL